MAATDKKSREEQDRHDKQVNQGLVCLMGMASGHLIKCLIERCAGWDTGRYCCGMLPYKEVTVTGSIDTHQY